VALLEVARLRFRSRISEPFAPKEPALSSSVSRVCPVGLVNHFVTKLEEAVMAVRYGLEAGISLHSHCRDLRELS